MICKSIASNSNINNINTIMITLILHVVLLSTQRHGATHSFSEAVLAETRSMEGHHLPAMMIPPASPDCWLSAFKSLDHGALQFTSAGAAVAATMDAEACTFMASEHQKVLALELARCHLKDLGRSLMKETKTTVSTAQEDDYNDDDDDDVDEEYSNTACSNTDVSRCLTELTDIGVTTYTHFFSYVNQLCVRLLQEVLVDQYQTTSHKLAKSSELAEERLQQIIQDQESLWTVWTQREEDLASLHEHLRTELMEQSDLVTSHVLSVQSNLRENEQKWLSEQEEIRNHQAKEFEQQQRELQRLSEALKTTQQAMTPWYHGLRSMAAYALTVYAWLQLFIVCLPMTCLVLLLTMPKRLRWMRFKMMAFLLVETALELYVQETGGAWMPLSADEVRTSLQYALFGIEAGFYVLGFFFSFGLCGGRGNSDDNDNNNHKHGQEQPQTKTPTNALLTDQEAFFKNLQASRGMFEAATATGQDQQQQQQQTRAQNPRTGGQLPQPIPPFFNNRPNASCHYTYNRTAFMNSGNFGAAQAANNNPYFFNRQQQPWMPKHAPFLQPNTAFRTTPMNQTFVPQRPQTPWVSPSTTFQSPPQQPGSYCNAGPNATWYPFEDIDPCPCSSEEEDSDDEEDLPSPPTTPGAEEESKNDDGSSPGKNDCTIGQKRSFEEAATCEEDDEPQCPRTKRCRFNAGHKANDGKADVEPDEGSVASFATATH